MRTLYQPFIGYMCVLSSCLTLFMLFTVVYILICVTIKVTQCNILGNKFTSLLLILVSVLILKHYMSYIQLWCIFDDCLHCLLR